MSLWSLGTKIQKHSNLDQIAKVGEGPLACGLLRLPNGGGCQWACLFLMGAVEFRAADFCGLPF